MGAAALAMGSGLQAYMSAAGGIQKQAAYAAQAREKEAAAAEVQIGANRDVQLVRDAADRTKSAQLSAFAKSGVSVSSGSPLGALERTASNAWDQVDSIQRAANYRKSMLGYEAQQANILGDEAASAGIIGAVTSGVSAFSKNPYTYDQGGAGPSESILTNSGGSKISNTGIDAADYDTANYARMRYGGNL